MNIKIQTFSIIMCVMLLTSIFSNAQTCTVVYPGGSSANLSGLSWSGCPSSCTSAISSGGTVGCSLNITGVGNGQTPIFDKSYLINGNVAISGNGNPNVQIGVTTTTSVNVTINGNFTLPTNNQELIIIGGSSLTMSNGTLALSGGGSPALSGTGVISAGPGGSLDFGSATCSLQISCPILVGSCTGTVCSSSSNCSPAPTFTSSLTGSRCGTGTVLIGATASVGTINWFNVSIGGTSLGSGSTFTTSSISTNTTFFGAISNCINVSRIVIIASVSGLSIGATPTINGVASLCQSTLGIYTATGITNATAYNWTMPSGFTISSGSGTSVIGVSISGSSSGSILVGGSNSCETGLVSSKVITINPSPTVPGVITGSTAVCVSTTGMVYSITSVSGYIYNWILPTGFATTSGANTNSVTLSVSGSAVSSVISVTGTNTCGNSAVRSSAVTVNASGLWLGTSTDWNNSLNWCGGIPTAGSSPIISSPSSNYPIINASGVGISNLSILGTASLGLSGSFTLSISGNLVNNGTLSMPSGSSLILNGNIQSLGGTSTLSLDNMIVAGSGTKSLNTTVGVTGMLTLISATLASDGNLVLVSNANGTANVSSLSGTATITGNVRVQNFMGAKINRRYLSFPVQNATISQLQSSIWVNGLGTGFDLPSYIPSILTYDETLSGQVNIGKTRATSTSQVFLTGVGYEILVRPRTVAPTETRANQTTTAVNLEVVGTLNQGNILIPITFTNTGNVTADGFNFVGNPYPSNINWTATGWTKTNIAPSIYFLDPGSSLTSPTTLAAQSYTYIPGVGCSPAVFGCNSLIAQGQGFYVLATSSGAVLSITESVKSTGVARRNFRTEENQNQNLIHVSVVSPTNIIDETVVRIGENYSDSYENASTDVVKFTNSNMNLSTQSKEGYSLVLNSISLADTLKVVPLVFSSNVSGTYNMTVSETVSLLADVPVVYLRNNVDSSLTEVKNSERVSFVHVTSVTSAPKYSLVMKKSVRTESPTSVKSKLAKNEVAAYPNPFSDGLTLTFIKEMGSDFTVELVNMIGNVVFSKTYSSLEIKGGKLEIEKLDVPSSSYVLQVKNSKGLNQSIKVAKY